MAAEPACEKFSSGDEAQNAKQVENQWSRGERRARKMFQRLGLKPIQGIDKVEILRSRAAPIHVSTPCVYELPGKVPTYVILGGLKVAHLQEEYAKFAQTAKALQSQAQVKPTVVDVNPPPPSDLDDASVDTTGLDEKDIRLAMEQSQQPKAKVVAALRNTKGDLIEAIMQLTS